jgi:hypothetical protein
MFTTESLVRPAAVAGRNTLLCIAARRESEVMMATSVVFRRLALKGSARITSTGQRFPGLRPWGFPSSADQTPPSADHWPSSLAKRSRPAASATAAEVAAKANLPLNRFLCRSAPPPRAGAAPWGRQRCGG